MYFTNVFVRILFQVVGIKALVIKKKKKKHENGKGHG